MFYNPQDKGEIRFRKMKLQFDVQKVKRETFDGVNPHRVKQFSLLLILTCSCNYMTAQDSNAGRGMTESMHELQEVVITSTGTQHLLKNTPVQTEVISRKMLESYGGKSLEDILSGLTASFAFNEGDMGSQTQLNGLGNNYILIMIDGKRIHGDVGGENDLGLIDPHNIERIEIVKGAQSALYGSDAMAGVINIITKKHDTDGVLLENSTRYGSYDDLRQHNGIGLRWGRWQSYTSFQLQHTDGWQNTTNEYAEAMMITDTRNRTLNKYTNWQLSERLTVDLGRLELYADGSYYTKRIYRPTNGRHPSCDVYTYDLKYRNASAAVGGKWMTGNGADYLTFDINWDRHAYYYAFTDTTLEDGYYRGEQTHYFPYFPGQTELQSDQQRTMANVKGVFYLPHSNTLNVGAEYRYDYLKAPMRVEGGKADDWTAAVYAQDEFDPCAWLNITAGLRVIDNNAFGLHVTPKLSTMLSIGDWRLRAGWSQGFKSPTTKELGYHYVKQMGANTYYYMGNAKLDAQTSNYWSANVEYRTNRITCSVTGYFNRLDKMISLINVPVSEIPPGATSAFAGDGSTNIIPRMYKNAEDAKTYGVDVNITYNISKELTLGGNYSYLDTKANVYNTTHNVFHEVIIDGMAHHKWNGYITWNHRFSNNYRLGLNLSSRGSSRRYYENDGDGKPFQLWRLNTTHDFGHSKTATYRVELGVDNLFNFKDTSPRPYHLGTTNPGTTIFATLTVKFNKGKKVKATVTRSTKEEEE